MALSGIVTAQQPTPGMVVVQAAGTTTAPNVPATANAASQDAAIAAAIKALEQTKTANDALLKKQEAMLQQLDELQKAAEQLKTFSKRG
jgi:hypothetical protein